MSTSHATRSRMTHRAANAMHDFARTALHHASRRTLHALLPVIALSPAIALLGGCAAEEPASEPLDVSVLLITLDTTRADYLGAYGNESAETPHLDRLAREGTRFDHCVACTPLTLPSHSTIMTGTYPFVHEVRQNTVDKLGDDSVTLAEVLQGKGYFTHASVGSIVLRKRFGLRQGFESYGEPEGGKTTSVAGAERRGDAVCEEVKAVLDASGARRFFIWAHFYDPHYPYLSDSEAANDSPEAYAEEIRFMDAQIGRLLSRLTLRGLLDETLVVIVGDHGEGLGDHGEAEHGYFLHETTMRVPLIWWLPGTVAAGQVIEDLVGTVDIMPTILDFIGEPVPAGVQGRSLRSALAGQGSPQPAVRYGESIKAHAVLGLSTQQAVYRDAWKLVHSTVPELYDLDSDPAEERNLFAARPEVAGEMFELLQELLAAAPVAGRADETTIELSEQELQQLRALGYVGGTSDESGGGSAAAGLMLPEGDSPLLHAAMIRLYVDAQRLLARDDYAGAEAALREVLRDLPDAPHPLRDLALCLRKQDREAEIESFCVATLRAAPGSGRLRLYHARRLLRAQRFEEGAAELHRLIEREPRNSIAHLELGHAMAGLRRYDDARRHYEHALGLDPLNGMTLRALALMSRREGRLEEAVDYLRRAVEANPGSAQLRRDLERFQQELKP